MSRPGWRDIHLVPAKVELIIFSSVFWNRDFGLAAAG